MKIINRRAKHDYEILETYEAGIKLTGPEVKSVKLGRIKLDRSFVKILDSEVHLVNLAIAPYPYARQKNYDPSRTRKLLLHKKEITSISSKTHKAHLTLVPVSCYTKRGLIKIQIGLAKGKKKYEKRRAKKQKDIEREIERELRERSV